MKENWKDDNCAAMQSHYAVYSVPKAAALWCETGTGYLTEAKLNKAITEAMSLFVGVQGGTVDGMDIGTTAFFGLSWDI